MPVYETGIDGIGFQVSDLLESKNGALVPAVAGSVLIPFENTSDNYYKFITVVLSKPSRSLILQVRTQTHQSAFLSVIRPLTLAPPKTLIRLALSSKALNIRQPPVISHHPVHR